VILDTGRLVYFASTIIPSERLGFSSDIPNAIDHHFASSGRVHSYNTRDLIHLFDILGMREGERVLKSLDRKHIPRCGRGMVDVMCKIFFPFEPETAG
jgi:hypothetical protein